MNDLIPRDLADNDLYKFTMGQVVFRQFDNAIARYRYTNRAKDKSYPNGFAEQVMEQVNGMANLSLTEDMYRYFKARCPWLRETYLQWLRCYRYNPSQVKATQDASGALSIEVEGPWFETIYWEVPLLYIVSELANAGKTMDSNWRSKIDGKAQRLLYAGVNWIDFGTRRRAAFAVQDEVCRIMKRFAPTPEHPSGFRGTSNPYLGMKHDLTSHGTNAHELTMAMQAKYGLAMCNRATMEHWVEEFGGYLGIALTDTVTTPVFLRDFDQMYARLYDGVRQDSGDPKVIGDMYIEHYKRLGIDPTTKILVLSDSLTTDKAVDLHNYFKGRIKVTMGIGTHLTNDVGWAAANHVIKLTEINFGHGFQPLLKLSDDVGKHLGGSQLIEDAFRTLRIAATA